MNSLSGAARRYLPSVLIFIAVGIAWQLVVSFVDVREYILPRPASVWQAMTDPSLRWGHRAMITTLEVLGGFVVAAVGGILLLPVGLQIVGPMHADLLVLQAARAFEQAQPWAAARPSCLDA